MAVAAQPAAPSFPVTPDKLVDEWRKRITAAREYRKQFEPIWLSNLAFAGGQMWLAWDNRQKRMRNIADLDPRYAGRELYTADRINEQRQAQLGELSTGDDRPELLLAQEGDSAEELQKQINAAVQHGWDYEWGSDQALLQVRRLCLDIGTAAIRCRFDPTLGPVLQDQVPHLNGRPVTDLEQARTLLADGPRPDVEMRTIHEGRTVWEPLSAFNLLVPAGVTHEDQFPWEVVVRPVAIDKVAEEYRVAPDALQEDNDIASVIGLSTSQQLRTSSALENASTRGRLRGHVWLFTCYERPCRDYPNGRTVVLASNQFRLLAVDEQLPYEAPDKTRRSGISYFHWWRLNDRFFSRAFIEPMKDPQRLINRRETQNAEIIDRGMPKVFTKEGDLIHNPNGLPLENVELKADAAAPNFFAGMGPGQWMYQDIEHHVENLAHASTLSPLRLGENPQNVDTYSQLALLNENEQAKRSTINQEHDLAIARLVEDSVWDVRRYWPQQKQILVGGDENQISRQVFDKSKIPDFYVVKIPKGSSQPRSQGAELTKIDAIWTAALSSGVAANPAVSERWLRWYTESLNAGQALELPEADSDSQVQLAGYENFLMVEQGVLPQVADYDLAPVHIPVHREAQDQARGAGEVEVVALIDQHIQAHVAAAQQNAARIAASQQAPSPAGPPSAAPPASRPIFPQQLLPPPPAPAVP